MIIDFLQYLLYGFIFTPTPRRTNVSTSSMTPSKILATIPRPYSRVRFSHGSDGPATLASLVTTASSGARLLVAVSSDYIKMLLHKRMGDFASFFLSNAIGHSYSHCSCAQPTDPFKAYGDGIDDATKRETTEVVSRWGDKWLAELDPAAYADEPLGVWNPITRQAEDLAGAAFVQGFLAVTLFEETDAALLKAFYEPFHRALGLDLLRL
jgi:hypothetical protein